MTLLDSFMTGGRAHPVCEDYALTGEKCVPYMIVSDGCSSSKNTDVGSRILALVAQRQLDAALIYETLPDHSNYFGLRILESAETVSDQLGVNRSALDATLLVAWADEHQMHIVCYGDGHIITRFKSGLVTLHQMSYAQNAPFYLTVIKPDILKKWKECYASNALEVRHYAPWDAATPQVVDCRGAEYFTLALPVDQLDTVMIASDGIATFGDSDGRAVPVHEVVRGMLDIKLTGGAYLQRTMRRLVDGYRKAGVSNFDDVSVASFIFQEKA